MLTRRERTPLRKLMLLGAMAGAGALVEDTATGNPLTFQTDLARPLKSLLIPFTPVQSGAGDPSPYNIWSILPWDGLTVFSGGKNLFDKNGTNTNNGYVARGYLTSDGSITDSANYKISEFISVVGGKDYTLSNLTGASPSIVFYDATKTYLSGSNYNSRSTKTITSPSNAKYCRISIPNAKIDELQLEAGQTATAYEPYKPITETDIVFPAHGKNLVTGTNYGGEFYNVGNGADLAKSATYVSYTEDGNTIEVTTGKVWQSAIFATGLLSPGTYNIHYESESPNLKISSYVTDKDLVTLQRNSVVSNNTTVTLTETARIAVVIGSSQIETVTVQNLQVEEGSYYTSWEAFDNSVYGCTLDVVSGVLTVTHIIMTRHKSDFGNEQTGEINYRNLMLMESVPKPSSGVNWNKARETQCLNCGKIANPYSETTYGNYIGVMLYAQLTGVIFRISSPLYDALSDDDEITICYEIAEPQTVTLTPTQITALIGNNTIWSDANGQMTAVYLKKK